MEGNSAATEKASVSAAQQVIRVSSIFVKSNCIDCQYYHSGMRQLPQKKDSL
jgi:hypothetical protein